MKRATKRWRVLIAAFVLMSVSAAAQQPGASNAATGAAPQEQKNGTGVVPPGVKLVPAMPGAGAPKAFHFPQAATKTLPNGLRVFVVTDHEQPSISARMVILTAGSIKDPAAMPGVAARGTIYPINRLLDCVPSRTVTTASFTCG